MSGGKPDETDQFTDLRLRLDAVAGGVRATLVRCSDGAELASDHSDLSVQSLHSRAGQTMIEHRFDRVILRRIGEELGLAAFPGSVAATIVSEASRRPIRLQIASEDVLSEIPWEVSVLTGLRTGNYDFAALCPQISMTRHVESGIPQPRRSQETRRVLVAWANPGSHRYPRLHYAEKEAEGVIRALRSAECSTVQVEELPFATVSSLLRSLADRRPDVLHFIGHGDVAPTGGAIVLEGGMPGTEGLLYAEDLAQAVVDAGTSLAVLSGCLTSGSPKAIGTKLALAGVPAVLAMSIPILDIAAHQFARAMYSSLAAGAQLDEAVFEGRCALAGIGADFAAPQLMLSGSGPVYLSRREQSTQRADPSERRTNLTYEDRPFIGRTKERSELRNKIRDQGQRLVTITGPGGMGKTRLSKQVAAELIDSFPDGVWLVDCEALPEEQDLIAGIAAATPFGSGVETKQGLIDSISRKRTLVVLDCFENSVAQGALIEDLLRHTEGLHCLVTSRLVLGLPREHEFPLPSMSVRSKGGESADGVSLFAEAAGHAMSGFTVTTKNRKQISELCSSLEGVPLAIVLAAGRLRHMSLIELADQVREQPVATLRRRTGGIERHSNIESVVAASFALLPIEERRMLRMLGTFVGSFTLADAAIVCDMPEPEQIKWISDLRDHSLVQILQDEVRTRYKLLDTVRDYLTHLPIEESVDVDLLECRRRHAEHYTVLAGEIGRLVAEGRWSAGTTAMMRYIGNLRLAIATAALMKRDDLVASMVSGLARRFFEAGLLTDFRNLADAGYDAASRTGDQTIRIQLMGLDGALASRQGDEEKCEKIWLERVDLCRAVRDVKSCVDALIDLAWQAFENHQPTKSRLRLIEALRMSRFEKDPAVIATVRIVQARLAFASSNLRLARVRNVQAERLLPEFETRNGALFVCQLLAISCRELGDWDRNIQFSVKLLRLSIERNQVIHAGWALLELAPMYEQAKDMDSATRCYYSAMKVHAEYSTRHRTRATSAFNQFKRKHEGPQLTLELAGFRNKTWQEIVEGLGTREEGK